jgi:O-acetyl-ADP-ribose deacetylase (regulator of RNase III)
MIEITRGDIVRADAEALVNTVNCVGVMGRGIALQFRKAFPGNFREYKAMCDRKELHPGKVLVHDLGRLTNPRYIINFPTKNHWKGRSRLEDIDAGLTALITEVRARGIRSIAVPPLGCGLGGLEWEDVRPRIQRAFASLPDVHVLLYEPAGAPAAVDIVKQPNPPRMTIGRAALVGLMRRYLIPALDPFVSLLEVHKLMYFMQEAGEPLKLRFQEGPYGPYAENLRHVLTLVDGHYITGYGDGDDRPDRKIELVPEAVTHATEFLSDHPATEERFARVTNLIEGFETPYGMELLATVHWVMQQKQARTPDEAVGHIYRWNDRKRMFSREHIRLAWETLVGQGWLHPHE